jgi:hypothetical protein
MITHFMCLPPCDTLCSVSYDISQNRVKPHQHIVILPNKPQSDRIIRAPNR